jgi:hypothetical protein
MSFFFPKACPFASFWEYTHTHILQNEDVSLKPDSDPYVCFRRRELKPQRKLRRDDGQSLEKLKKLRDELLKAKELLELVALRESTRKESLALDMQLFEQKCIVRKLRKKLGLPCIEKDWDTAPLIRPRKKLLKKGPFGRGEEESKETSTKIRIPMRKIRDAANLVTDLDAAGQYGTFSLSLTTEEKVKKKKLTEEKDGWMDVTEVIYFYCCLYSLQVFMFLYAGPVCWPSVTLQKNMAQRPSSTSSRRAAVSIGSLPTLLWTATHWTWRAAHC